MLDCFVPVWALNMDIFAAALKIVFKIWQSRMNQNEFLFEIRENVLTFI